MRYSNSLVLRALCALCALGCMLASALQAEDRIYSLFDVDQPIESVTSYYSQCARHSAYLYLMAHDVRVDYDTVKKSIDLDSGGGATLEELSDFIKKYIKEARVLKLSNYDDLFDYMPVIMILKSGIDAPYFHSVFICYNTALGEFVYYDPQVGPAPVVVEEQMLRNRFGGIVISAK